MKKSFITLLLLIVSMASLAQNSVYSEISKIVKLGQVRTITTFILSEGYKFQYREMNENSDDLDQWSWFSKGCKCSSLSGIEPTNDNYSYIVVNMTNNGDFKDVSYGTNSLSTWNEIIKDAEKDGFTFEYSKEYNSGTHNWYIRKPDLINFVKAKDGTYLVLFKPNMVKE